MPAPLPPLTPRQEFAMRTSHVLCTMLRRIEPSDLDFHAQRYDSGTEFRALLLSARSCDVIPHDQLGDAVHRIALAGLDDGADYGTIPCLGGYARSVWQLCLAWARLLGYAHNEAAQH